jgi:hypothetical protein
VEGVQAHFARIVVVVVVVVVGVVVVSMKSWLTE